MCESTMMGCLTYHYNSYIAPPSILNSLLQNPLLSPNLNLNPNPNLPDKSQNANQPPTPLQAAGSPKDP